jgi:hypothetical protein
LFLADSTADVIENEQDNGNGTVTIVCTSKPAANPPNGKKIAEKKSGGENKKGDKKDGDKDKDTKKTYSLDAIRPSQGTVCRPFVIDKTVLRQLTYECLRTDGMLIMRFIAIHYGLLGFSELLFFLCDFLCSNSLLF